MTRRLKGDEVLVAVWRTEALGSWKHAKTRGRVRVLAIPLIEYAVRMMTGRPIPDMRSKAKGVRIVWESASVTNDYGGGDYGSRRAWQHAEELVKTL